MSDAVVPITILAGAVIPMTKDGVLRDQAITIVDDRITRIAPREQGPITGRVVDWRDRTLIPGLADCHVHVEEEADMLLNLAHGVTTVRNMRGKPWHLHWRRLVADGRRLGPHVVTTTPMADGRGAPGTTVWPEAALIADRDAAHEAVNRWAELGYDQVKAYQWLSAEALAGLGEACRDTGLPLVGHCPQVLTIHEAIDRGQTGFEHLNNYEYGALRSESQVRLDAFFSQGFSYERGRNRFSPDVAAAASDLDDAKIAAVADRLAAEDITSCPTLIVLDRVLGHRDMSEPRLRYVDPVQARTWQPENDFRFKALSREELQETRRLFNRRGQRILAALRDAGARVLVGTDSYNAFVFHGSSVVDEMELMSRAGYTPVELVEMATRGAADYLGIVDRGRIEAGFVADLMAVAGDPHASVTALRNPAAVVVGGTILERPDLDNLLVEAEALLHAEPDRSLLRSVPRHEELIGDYERTNFGQTDAVTRVTSCLDASSGTTTWREQVVSRGSTELRTAVIDTQGRLVSAEVERRRVEGVDSATVSRGNGGTYSVRTSLLDGSMLEATAPGPLRPGADLGTVAALAASRITPEHEPWQVLTLSTSLANSLAPVPGTLQHDGDELVQRTTDTEIRLSGSDDLAEYFLIAPMNDMAHRRTT